MEKHIHHENNHAWLHPKDVLQALPKLADKLMLIFPEHQQSIKQQLQLAQEQVKNIWQQWQDLVNDTGLKQRGVMMQHPAWQSLFQALGVPIRSTLESAQHGQEFGPRKLEKALNILKQYPSTVLIGSSKHSNRALQWVSKRTPQSIIKLDALGTCGESWQHLMQHNLDKLKAALAP
jgi:ABC-type Zn uptake system ZnuABC Zn-binding protein ZnuA